MKELKKRLTRQFVMKVCGQKLLFNSILILPKDRARDLEKQLQEALGKNKGCSSGCLGMVAAIVSIASVACWLVCLMI